MNDNSIYAKVKQLGEGIFYCGWFKGYIEIKQKNDIYQIFWTSNKDYHDPLSHSAVCIFISEKEIINVFESAINMYPVTDIDEKADCIIFINKKIELAYKKHKKHE